MPHEGTDADALGNCSPSATRRTITTRSSRSGFPRAPQGAQRTAVLEPTLATGRQSCSDPSAGPDAPPPSPPKAHRLSAQRRGCPTTPCTHASWPSKWRTSERLIDLIVTVHRTPRPQGRDLPALGSRFARRGGAGPRRTSALFSATSFSWPAAARHPGRRRASRSLQR
jgi:hypothetical protein